MLRRRRRRGAEAGALVDVLIVSSTFPSTPEETKPDFVLRQVKALKAARPHLRIAVLAPHEAAVPRPSQRVHEEFTEYRFHYAWPRRLETLNSHGILPSLREKPWRWALVPLFVLSEIFSTLRLSQRLRPRALYAHWFTPQAIACAISGAAIDRPFAYTSHANDIGVLHLIGRAGDWLVRTVTRRASAVSVDGRGALERLARALGVESDDVVAGGKVKILPMGIDPSIRLASARPDESRRSVLFLGRLAEKKGCSVLISAWRQVVELEPTAQLVIAGDGPLRAALEEQAKNTCPAESVAFVGFVTGDQKRALLAEASIVALPSITLPGGDTEGLPVVLLEALAAGCLCVTTPASHAENLVAEAGCGVIVPERDATRLAEGIVSLLTTDKRTVTRMRASAELVGGRFEWPSWIEVHASHLLDPMLQDERRTLAE